MGHLPHIWGICPIYPIFAPLFPRMPNFSILKVKLMSSANWNQRGQLIFMFLTVQLKLKKWNCKLVPYLPPFLIKLSPFLLLILGIFAKTDQSPSRFSRKKIPYPPKKCKTPLIWATSNWKYPINAFFLKILFYWRNSPDKSKEPLQYIAQLPWITVVWTQVSVVVWWWCIWAFACSCGSFLSAT